MPVTDHAKAVQAQVETMMGKSPPSRPVSAKWVVYERANKLYLRPIDRQGTIPKPARDVGVLESP